MDMPRLSNSYSKMVPFSSAPGTHPDSALPTSGLVDFDRTKILKEYTCPFCNKKGSKSIIGHARYIRKTTDGCVSSYDVYTVDCVCGRKLAVWNEDANPETLRRVAESVCQPNGKFQLAVGNGELPPIDPQVLDYTN